MYPSAQNGGLIITESESQRRFTDSSGIEWTVEQDRMKASRRIEGSHEKVASGRLALRFTNDEGRCLEYVGVPPGVLDRDDKLLQRYFDDAVPCRD